MKQHDAFGARHRAQRHAGLPRQVQGQRCRRRHRRQQRDTDGGRLLHQFEAAPAGHDREAVDSATARPGSRAPIILSSALCRPTSSRASRILPPGVAPRGGMDRAVRPVHRLKRRQLRERRLHRRRVSASKPGQHRVRFPHHALQALRPAQPAAGAAFQSTACAAPACAISILSTAISTRDAAGLRLHHDAFDIREGVPRISSPRVNPTAKSSRSAGVAIITACDRPL